MVPESDCWLLIDALCRQLQMTHGPTKPEDDGSTWTSSHTLRKRSCALLVRPDGHTQSDRCKSWLQSFTYDISKGYDSVNAQIDMAEEEIRSEAQRRKGAGDFNEWS